MVRFGAFSLDEETGRLSHGDDERLTSLARHLAAGGQIADAARLLDEAIAPLEDSTLPDLRAARDLRAEL
jgi:hypothetical protein